MKPGNHPGFMVFNIKFFAHAVSSVVKLEP
jgi:hypothetical protein